MCFGCSKEPSHLDGSFEYPQHIFWMSNKENSFPIRTLICPDVRNKPVCEIIRISYECGGGIVGSLNGITRLAKARQGWNFLYHHHKNNGFVFFLLTL